MRTNDADDIHDRMCRLICDYKDGIADDDALCEALNYLADNWYEILERYRKDCE